MKYGRLLTIAALLCAALSAVWVVNVPLLAIAVVLIAIVLLL